MSPGGYFCNVHSWCATQLHNAELWVLSYHSRLPNGEPLCNEVKVPISYSSSEEEGRFEDFIAVSAPDEEHNRHN